MEVRTLINDLLTDGQFASIINNRFAQFGVPAQRAYLGATIFPERTDVPRDNQYRESFIRYRSPIANASTRYSPPQMKRGVLMGSMFVELTESDIAAQFDAAEYDALIDMIVRLPNDAGLAAVPEEAMLIALRWFDLSINRPLVEYNEKMIWDCLVDAQVVGKGDNGFTITVDYPNPAGSRLAAGGNWGNPAYDPYPDILTQRQWMIDAGYELRRMVASTKVISQLTSNPNIGKRLGIINITSNVLAGMPGVVTLDKLNELFSRDGLPPIERYDLKYQDQLTSKRFLKDDVLVMIPSTERNIDVVGPDGAIFQAQSTLGYMGLGRPTNRTTNGRAFRLTIEDGKAAPIYAEGWQTSLPVNMHPDGVATIYDTNDDGL